MARLKKEKAKPDTGLKDVVGIRARAFPQTFAPMLASPCDAAFDKPDWIYEPKLDGIRAIALVHKGVVKLLSRRGLDLTGQYPGIVSHLKSSTESDLVLDGEIICLNEIGRPSFQHLQQRLNLTRFADIMDAEQRYPAFYFVFDLMQAGELDLTGVELLSRKKLLRSLLNETSALRILQHFENHGILAYDACIENGFEGLVAKRANAHYEPGRRSPSWLKLKAQQTGEFVIGGYSQGTGWRSSTFGSLTLGYYDEAKRFVYAGSVGTGFDDRLIAEVMKRMEPHKQKQCPFWKRPEDKKDAQWVAPHIVIEIKFMDWTRDGHLRTPVFLRFRDDVLAADVRRQRILTVSDIKPAALDFATESGASGKATESGAERKATRSGGAAAGPATNGTVRDERPSSSSSADRPAVVQVAAPTATPLAKIEPRIPVVKDLIGQLSGKEVNTEICVQGEVIKLTHLTKVLWPAYGGNPPITKRDYLRYLASVGPFMLAHMLDRPLTVIRSPYGIAGKAFFQKHWTDTAPDFLETMRVIEAGEAEEYPLCNNLASLIWLGQNGVLEYHVWTSRACGEDGNRMDFGVVSDGVSEHSVDKWLEFPDYLVFDLDRHVADSEAPEDLETAFAAVRECSFILKEMIDALGLKSFVKISGKNGIHLYLPVVRNLDFEDARALAEAVTRTALQHYADKFTIEQRIEKRTGRVFLDFGPNGRGKTIVAPYSARISKDGTVSCPVSWKELEDCEVRSYRLDAVAERLHEHGDIWSNILASRKDLKAIIKRK